MRKLPFVVLAVSIFFLGVSPFERAFGEAKGGAGGEVPLGQAIAQLHKQNGYECYFTPGVATFEAFYKGLPSKTAGQLMKKAIPAMWTGSPGAHLVAKQPVDAILDKSARAFTVLLRKRAGETVAGHGYFKVPWEARIQTTVQFTYKPNGELKITGLSNYMDSKAPIFGKWRPAARITDTHKGVLKALNAVVLDPKWAKYVRGRVAGVQYMTVRMVPFAKCPVVPE